MNKIVIKNTLIFTAGIAIGAVAAIGLTRAKYEAIVQEELDSIRESREKRKQQLKEELDSLDETSATLQDRIERRRYRNEAGRYNNEMDVDKGSDPSEYERPKENDDESYREWEKISDRASRDKYDAIPYIISVKEFSEEMDHFDKSTIYFYEDDKVLADENEEPIENVTSIVGNDALFNFGKDSGDPEIVYVRNMKLSIDYEVIRLSKGYGETVGMVYDNE